MNPKLRYHLPSGYKVNAPISLDETSEEEYWTADRRNVANRFQEPFYAWVDTVLSKTRPVRVADVGCGTAVKMDLLAQKYPDIEFLGIDQPGFKAKVRVGMRADLQELNLDSDLTWGGAAVDVVICSDVIEHLGQPEILLTLISTMIGKKGICMISTPDRATLRGKHNRQSPNPSHVREWTFVEFQAFLRDAGFVIMEKKRLMPIVLRPDTLSTKWLVKRMRQGRGLKTNQAFIIRNS